eukprot:1957958-Rhodomonas_salina.2
MPAFDTVVLPGIDAPESKQICINQGSHPPFPIRAYAATCLGSDVGPAAFRRERVSVRRGVESVPGDHHWQGSRAGEL